RSSWAAASSAWPRSREHTLSLLPRAAHIGPAGVDAVGAVGEGGCRRYAFPMCGIVGYVGPDAPSERPLEVVLEGLRRLEYRGYDSAGVAVVTPEGMVSAKKAGKLTNLIGELDQRRIPAGTTAIGHTRWATHGGPTDANAHPHLAGGGQLARAHTGPN